jgi:hypothetical protein
MKRNQFKEFINDFKKHGGKLAQYLKLKFNQLVLDPHQRTPGNIVFCILHLFALLFTGCSLLFFTIPMHMIYIAIINKK